MAGDWIKMRTNIDTDPAVVRIASALHTDRYGIVGRLHKIWSWANEHLTDGQDVPIDAEFLDCLVETPGFSAELRRVGWLSGRDGCLSFPSFERHNGASAKARAQDAARKRSVRNASAKCPAVNRTESGLEKRREEKRRVNNRNQSRELSEHWKSEDFQAAWFAWLSHVAAKDSPVTEPAEEAMLYQLARFATEEAIEVVRFSTLKQCKNLILNGDHKSDLVPRKSTGGNRSRRMEVVSD